MYTLRPDSGRMPNKLLSEVTIKDNVKIVTLRSTYKVVNQTLYPLEVTLVDNTGRPVYAVEKIGSYDSRSLLPYLSVYVSPGSDILRSYRSRYSK